jgi:TrmH family RNA methyltransferase
VRRLRALLADPAERRDRGRFAVEGAPLIQEACRAGWQPIEVLRSPSSAAEFGATTVLVAAEGVVERVATTETPRGEIATFERRTADVPAGDCWVVVANGVSDPGNLGTIIRCAEAAGAGAVVVVRGTTDAFAPKVVRSTAGAMFHVPICEVESLEELRRLGVRLMGTTSGSGATSFRDADFSGRLGIVVGNEAHGLDPSAPVDGWVTIPHAGRAESLNVAMAAAVLCFEVAHRRGQ